VQWDRNKVNINQYTIRKNGITYESLKNGISFNVMKSRVSKIFKNKIVVTVGGHADFRALDLDIMEHMTFDLQSFYNRTDPNNIQQQQGMSLRDIFFFHFGTDCQKGEHSALQDAKNTHKCFMDGYTKEKSLWSSTGKQCYDFSDQVNLNSKEKHNKLTFCSTLNLFSKNCKCTECKNVRRIDCQRIDLFD